MTLSSLKYTSEFPVSAAELFAWYQQDGAFERLNPPWDPVDVISHDGTITSGSKAVISTPVLGLPIKWNIKHTDFTKNKLFTDELVNPPLSIHPFKKWTHKHVFTKSAKEPKQVSNLTDEIKYKPSFGVPGHFFTNSFIEKNLDRVFSYRHAILRSDIVRIKKIKLALGFKNQFSKVDFKIAVTGASGFVGKALVAFLKCAGFQVITIGRGVKPNDKNHICWDYKTDTLHQLNGVDVVINMAGEPIANSPWSMAKKREIYSSRVNGTIALVSALRKLKQPPELLISFSGINYYGNRVNRIITENSSTGEGFLANVCTDWERAALDAQEFGIRVVTPRVGVVLASGGGVLDKIVTPLNFFVGGPIGSGNQVMSWISRRDLIYAILHVITDKSIHGGINFTCNSHVTNEQLINTLGDYFSRPVSFAMPEIMVKLIFGEMGDETILSNLIVEPKVLNETGFEFSDNTLKDMLEVYYPKKFTHTKA